MLWVGLIIASFLLIVPILLYIPFVQNLAKDIAISRLEQSTGMDINVDYLRLRFPLDVELNGLTIVETTGDTLLSARSANIDVAFWLLLRSSLKVSEAELQDAFYRLNTPDSAVYMLAHIDRFTTVGTGMKFNMESINVGQTVLDGGDITLILKDTTVVTPKDTTPPSAMIIDASDVELRNVKVKMQMLPTIDSLGVDVLKAHLLDGHLDMLAQTIDVGSLNIDSVAATYLLPIASSPTKKDIVEEVVSEHSAPWTINARKINLTGRSATYAVRGATPAAGLDMTYIQAKNVVIDIDSFYNCGTQIKVPLRRFVATERCGLTLNGVGVFEMDSTLMRANDFSITTDASSLSVNAIMGLGDMKVGSQPLQLNADGHLAVRDIALAMPNVGIILRDLPSNAAVMIDADIQGSSSVIDIRNLKAAIPRYISLNAFGRVSNPLDFNSMRGHMDIHGAMENINFAKSIALASATSTPIHLPAFTIDGKVDYNPGLVAGNIEVKSGDGVMAADGHWQRRNDGYDVSVTFDGFPVQNFMPSIGVGNLSAIIKADGRGFDISSSATRLNAEVELNRVEYNGEMLRDIRLTATLDSCRVRGNLVSNNPIADFDAVFAGWHYNDKYEWDLSGDVRHLDMMALHLSDQPLVGKLNIYTNGSFDGNKGDIDAELELTDVNCIVGDNRLSASSLSAMLQSADSLTQASLESGDFDATFMARCSLDTLVGRFVSVSEEVSRQIDDKYINVHRLQQLVPQMNFRASFGASNVVANYLSQSDIHFKTADITCRNDSLLHMQAAVGGFSTGNVKLDQINVDINQKGRYLVYKLGVDNKPGTMDDFAHVSLNGFLSDNKMSAMLRQSNIHDEQGFWLGFNSTISDSTLSVGFVPDNPTIGYKKWNINRDNKVYYDFKHRHLDANLKLSSDSSSLHLYTVHQPDSASHVQEDVVLRLANIDIAEWLSISPFAPPLKGDVDADLRFRWDKEQITGNGVVDLNEFYYGRERVGSFSLDLDVANESHSKLLRANAGLIVDGVKVITATGHLNDSTAVNPFLLDFSMIRFPLRVINPFLSKNVAQLSGMLNGRMDITGDFTNPIFNGYLNFDSTAVKVGFTGTSYTFSRESIPVDSNVVKFNDFTIRGLNDNPLHINGVVDARRLTDIRLNLGMKARDMQIVNSNRPRGANMYGKAFVDLDATVKGNMEYIDVNAGLNILAGTNVTYVMSESASALTSQSVGEMVKFVQFSDTAQMIQADTLSARPMAININANLIVSEGSTINVDLSTDGKNKVSLQTAGNLTYTQTPMSTDGRLTGRLNINNGFVRYSPPMMSEKNFKFQEGSYISFTGDMMNPTLNVKAVDRLKANVTQSGQNSRLVNFDVLLSVTNTLNNMNVAFDLSTNDDLTISNELSSMSPEQRANQAMNMLLYNVYTGPAAKGNANISGNPLFAFLESQLNTWTANNIRGVDISFGIDQYDKTTDGSTQTTTSYSYRVSKSLFNDRFKIVVGGNYSTDADTDENFAQNLINDISFEYMLNRSGSMYVRLFRHVGYESILEGEITQTGVGFVLKRKLNSLRDLFRFSRRHRISDTDNKTQK